MERETDLEPNLLETLRGLLPHGATLTEREKGPPSPAVTELLRRGLIELWSCGKATTTFKISERGRVVAERAAQQSERCNHSGAG